MERPCLYLRFIETKDDELVLLDSKYTTEYILGKAIKNKNGQWVTSLKDAGLNNLELITAFSHQGSIHYIFKLEDPDTFLE